MRKIIVRVVIFIIILMTFCLTSCNYEDEGQYARKRIMSLVSAINEKDTEKIKQFFSKTSQEKYITDEDVQQLIDLFPEGLVCYSDRYYVITSDGWEYTYEYSNVTGDTVVIDNATNKVYRFDFHDVIEDTTNEKNIGFTYLLISSEEKGSQYSFWTTTLSQDQYYGIIIYNEENMKGGSLYLNDVIFPDVQVFISKINTMLPFEKVIRVLGMTVEYDEAQRLYRVVNNDELYYLQHDYDEYYSFTKQGDTNNLFELTTDSSSYYCNYWNDDIYIDVETFIKVLHKMELDINISVNRDTSSVFIMNEYQ